METKFQTSFIPKRPMPSVGGATTPQRHHGTSLFMTIAVVIFLASVAGAGGIYAWKGILEKQQDDYKQQLAQREREFDLDLIEKLKRANIRIDAVNRLMANHLAVSQIFDVIARITVSKVRFTSLNLTNNLSLPGEGIQLEMKGYGAGMPAVAYQSDVLGQLQTYGLRKVVKNPILGDPTQDQDGKVSFGFTATIDPAAITYAKSVAGTAVDDSALGAPVPQNQPSPEDPGTINQPGGLPQ